MKKLTKMAYDAKENAYSPYSHIKIGAAVLGNSGKVYTGANIENIAYGSTICAERVAILKAISEGETEIVELAVTGDFDDFAYPCGACRQVMSEFMKEESIIYICKKDEECIKTTLSEILPGRFKENGEK